MFPDCHEPIPANFLSDGTLYHKGIVAEMLESVGLDVAGFMRRTVEIIEVRGIPGDANLYMHYVWNKYPHLYNRVNVKNELNGKYEGAPYSREEIEETIRNCTKNKRDVVTISIHSWG
jgi:hypothetical protein